MCATELLPLFILYKRSYKKNNWLLQKVLPSLHPKCPTIDFTYLSVTSNEDYRMLIKLLQKRKLNIKLRKFFFSFPRWHLFYRFNDIQDSIIFKVLKIINITCAKNEITLEKFCQLISLTHLIISHDIF